MPWLDRGRSRLKDLGKMLRQLLTLLLVLFVGGAIVVGIQSNWGTIMCWFNDETGSLGRTCAEQKISESKQFEGTEVVEITGIAGISDNVKQVEFNWRLKPTSQNPNPQSVPGTVRFRKYDDGWRVEEKIEFSFPYSFFHVPSCDDDYLDFKL